MQELIEINGAPKQVFLIGIRDGLIHEEEANSLFKELAGLAHTLDLEIVEQELVRIREKNPRYGMGSGKAQELADRAKESKVDCIVFDQDLSPSQQRNWELLAGIPVIDRQDLILRIFADRAKTREAELQIQLAQLKYALPRLAHMYIDLSRQRGGRYGTKGSGETKLEMDRRTVQRRIHQLEEDLVVVHRNRGTQRKKRARIPIPSCALVGYTNAGKSSLLNAMTDASVFVEDKLFATLDPTTRRIELGKGRPVLMTDTVGFIRRLPHDLVDAFRSTLEEVCLADLLIQVLDASDDDINSQYETTLGVLKELGADNIPRIVVLNKIDKIEDEDLLTILTQRFTDSIPISAVRRAGLDELAKRIDLLLSGAIYSFRFPMDRHDLAALLHRNGTVISELYSDSSIEMKARLGERTLGTLREWIVV